MKRALLVLLAAGTAHADIWQQAIDAKGSDVEPYDRKLAEGDEAAVSASSKSINERQIRLNLDAAVDAYRAAAKVNPKAGEPLYRIGQLLYSFYFDCDQNHMSTPPATCIHGARNDARARDIVEAWDAFEARTPLDPRMAEIRFRRALLRTKLIMADPTNRGLLEAAMVDYQTIVDRTDGLGRGRASSAIILGNLAETQMMLGNLDDSIEMYRRALGAGADTSALYGFAVALDRDERGSDALAIIKNHGPDKVGEFKQKFVEGDVFFVPVGEEHYYFALLDEAFGYYDSSVREWKKFIQSGAHPQFHARAKRHIDALLGKKNQRWQPPPAPDIPFGVP